MASIGRPWCSTLMVTSKQCIRIGRPRPGTGTEGSYGTNIVPEPDRPHARSGDEATVSTVLPGCQTTLDHDPKTVLLERAAGSGRCIGATRPRTRGPTDNPDQVSQRK